MISNGASSSIGFVCQGWDIGWRPETKHVEASAERESVITTGSGERGPSVPCRAHAWDMYTIFKATKQTRNRHSIWIHEQLQRELLTRDELKLEGHVDPCIENFWGYLKSITAFRNRLYSQRVICSRCSGPARQLD